jgi:hypothetical protein
MPPWRSRRWNFHPGQGSLPPLAPPGVGEVPPWSSPLDPRCGDVPGVSLVCSGGVSCLPQPPLWIFPAAVRPCVFWWRTSPVDSGVSPPWGLTLSRGWTLWRAGSACLPRDGRGFPILLTEGSLDPPKPRELLLQRRKSILALTEPILMTADVGSEGEPSPSRCFSLPLFERC